MGVIFETENSIKSLLYGKKANMIGMSQDFLQGRTRGINPVSLIKNSNNTKELNNNVKYVLLNNSSHDFLCFSLVMGLFCGVYNLYNYMYVPREYVDYIANSKIDSTYTKEFISNNKDKIYKYFNNKYDYDNNLCDSVLNSLFTCTNNSKLYNEECIHDLGKMLISSYINYNDKEFLDCEELIDAFEKKVSERERYKSV